MADNTKIEWTDATWNPLRGCSRVSEGCRHCYAEGVAARFSGPGLKFEGIAHRVGGEARWTGKVILVEEKLGEPLRWRRPRRIFVNSMSDLFHEELPDMAIDQVFAVMGKASWHTFQVLTKRAARLRAYMSQRRPLPNVWLGVSVEDQAAAEERVPALLAAPAALRFLSCEPLLGPLSLQKYLGEGGIDWVISGGESGPRARPPEPCWFRSLRDQCRAAGVPFFFKQWGAWAPDVQWGASAPGETGPMRRVGKLAAGHLLDGKEYFELPQT